MKHLFSVYGLTKEEESKVACVKVVAESIIDAIAEVNKLYPQIIVIFNIMNEGSVSSIQEDDIAIKSFDCVEFGNFEINIKFNKKMFKYSFPSKK